MRYPVKAFPLFFLFASAAPAADSLEIAVRLAQAGAPQLALARVERDQPGRADNLQQWLEWEPLHLSLLNESNRSGEVLERIEALSAGVPAEAARQLHWQGARAALHLGRGVQARGFLAQLLWQYELAEPQYREARRMVAQSYLMERRADEAFRIMLRYSQDFQPLSQGEAAAFTEGLLTVGARAEAGTWLAALDEAGPLKLLVRLKSGLIAPEQAIADARAALNPAPSGRSAGGAAKKPAQPTLPARSQTVDPAAYWTVILHAASILEDAALQVEARERLLNFRDTNGSVLSGTSGDDLWQSYFALALWQGNQVQLLLGDDGAWFGLGAKLADSSPAGARALFAHLAVHAGEPELKENARMRLAALLLQARLELAAARLFADSRNFPEGRELSPQVRFMLGEAAAQGKDYALAARLWSGLTQAFGEVPPDEWRLRRARVFAYGGAYEDAVEAVRMLPVAETAGQREILFALGELAESRGDAAPAAGYYLQAAAAGDALARKARFQAARSLERAGLREDARKQYLMLLQSAPDADQQDSIKRALARL